MTISRSYFWSAALIVVPVIILASLAALGLRAQRGAVRSDAQQQAQQIAKDLAQRFQKALIEGARATEATQGISLPVPPAIVPPDAAQLETALAAKDREALTRLTMSARGEFTSSGLPIATLAAIAALELGPPYGPEITSHTHVLFHPNFLTQRWLETLETIATSLPLPPPGNIPHDDPTYTVLFNATRSRNSWDHHQLVRQAFWDETKQAWHQATPGLHLEDGRPYWVVRYNPVDQPPPAPFPADPAGDPTSGTGITPQPNSLQVLTPDELAALLRFDEHRTLPQWIGLSMKLGGTVMTSVPSEPEKYCQLVGLENAEKQMVWSIQRGVRPSRAEWLDPAPSGEILATAPGHFTVTATLKTPEILFAPIDKFTHFILWILANAVLCVVVGLWVLKRNLDRERRLSELKSQFVSSVSHELRAPVGSLRLMADALDAGTVTGEQAQQFHKLMSQEGARLSSLIENVLDFARMEQDRKTYTLEEADIPSLVQDTVQLMTPPATARKITLQTSLQPLTQVPKVDARAIQQALINLLDNAVKFSPENETVLISLTENSAEKSWSLAVTDHGPGIPKAEHQRIFDRFYRLGNELRRETQGTGIGLSLVKHIVEGNGGTVRVLSEGRGATFEMLFPI